MAKIYQILLLTLILNTVSGCKSTIYIVEKYDEIGYMKTIYLKDIKSDKRTSLSMQYSEVKKFPTGSKVKLNSKKDNLKRVN